MIQTAPGQRGVAGLSISHSHALLVRRQPHRRRNTLPPHNFQTTEDTPLRSKAAQTSDADAFGDRPFALQLARKETGRAVPPCWSNSSRMSTSHCLVARHRIGKRAPALCASYPECKPAHTTTLSNLARGSPADSSLRLHESPSANTLAKKNLSPQKKSRGKTARENTCSRYRGSQHGPLRLEEVANVGDDRLRLPCIKHRKIGLSRSDFGPSPRLKRGSGRNPTARRVCPLHSLHRRPDKPWIPGKATRPTCLV